MSWELELSKSCPSLFEIAPNNHLTVYAAPDTGASSRPARRAKTYRSKKKVIRKKRARVKRQTRKEPAWKRQYRAAVKLTDAGKYDAAIQKLNAIKKYNDAGIYNYLGFAHRKLGKFDEAVSYY